MTRLLALVLVLATTAARAQPIRLVAAESVYAGLARQLAGPAIPITAILQNPAQDPHLFEPTPAVARLLTNATIVVYNGAGYDPWMRPLLTATAGPTPRRVIDVADLVHAASGGNPHLWYAPETMPALATALAQAFTSVDPANATTYATRLAAVRAALASLTARIAILRARHAGQPVAATEPVFGPMLTALGLRVTDTGFERAIMNNTEPSASDIATLEADLRAHRVRALIRNTQTDDDTTDHLAAIARQSGVPIVGVSETEPPDTSYQQWVTTQLAALDTALGPK
jgi:zinc/manganese transport system substrate-binding protein